MVAWKAAPSLVIQFHSHMLAFTNGPDNVQRPGLDHQAGLRAGLQGLTGAVGPHPGEADPVAEDRLAQIGGLVERRDLDPVLENFILFISKVVQDDDVFVLNLETEPEVRAIE